MHLFCLTIFFFLYFLLFSFVTFFSLIKHILVFSDDLELAKRALSYTNLDCYYIKNKNNIEDFAHMSICDHNVIGNSTFAWWAAYMNKNNGLVVAPKDFFGKKYSNFLLDDFYPAEWIIL